ncbi:UrcA family protein [Novosphingobium sp.]|uniref:UrcA family protein n=1 Tax=Novosphingobium sp. TaxID=1874826 RepID=UPI003B51D059
MMHASAWRPAMLAALIPVLALGAVPAFAQDAPEVHRMEVRYGDLDLTTTKGRATLERRLRHSAADVCDYNLSERLILDSAAERTCYTTALAHARVSMASAVSRTRMASNH